MGNPLCHFEFLSFNLKKAREFYGKIFDWAFDDRGMPGYVMIGNGKRSEGGIMLKLPQAPRHALQVCFRSSVSSPGNREGWEVSPLPDSRTSSARALAPRRARGSRVALAD